MWIPQRPRRRPEQEAPKSTVKRRGAGSGRRKAQRNEECEEVVELAGSEGTMADAMGTSADDAIRQTGKDLKRRVTWAAVEGEAKGNCAKVELEGKEAVASGQMANVEAAQEDDDDMDVFDSEDAQLGITCRKGLVVNGATGLPRLILPTKQVKLKAIDHCTSLRARTPAEDVFDRPEEDEGDVDIDDDRMQAAPASQHAIAAPAEPHPSSTAKKNLSHSGPVVTPKPFKDPTVKGRIAVTRQPPPPPPAGFGPREDLKCKGEAARKKPGVPHQPGLAGKVGKFRFRENWLRKLHGALKDGKPLAKTGCLALRGYRARYKAMQEELGTDSGAQGVLMTGDEGVKDEEHRRVTEKAIAEILRLKYD
ncbi:hypothetical protein HK101_006922, partial [Irineochytrium annulatum]